MKLQNWEIIKLGWESFTDYVEKMSKKELIGLLYFIYGYCSFDKEKKK